MHGWSSSLTIAGAFLGLIGAVLLARDALIGPLAWYRRDFFGTRSWELLRQDHERAIAQLRALPRPPYTPESIQRLVDESESKFRSMEWDSKEKARDLALANLERSRSFAAIGLVLVALSFACQFVSACMSAQ